MTQQKRKQLFLFLKEKEYKLINKLYNIENNINIKFKNIYNLLNIENDDESSDIELELNNFLYELNLIIDTIKNNKFKDEINLIINNTEENTENINNNNINNISLDLNIGPNKSFILKKKYYKKIFLNYYPLRITAKLIYWIYRHPETPDQFILDISYISGYLIQQWKKENLEYLTPESVKELNNIENIIFSLYKYLGPHHQDESSKNYINQNLFYTVEVLLTIGSGLTTPPWKFNTEHFKKIHNFDSDEFNDPDFLKII